MVILNWMDCHVISLCVRAELGFAAEKGRMCFCVCVLGIYIYVIVRDTAVRYVARLTTSRFCCECTCTTDIKSRILH